MLFVVQTIRVEYNLIMNKMPNRVLVGVIALVTAIATLVFFSSNRADSQFESGTPEWVVQQYLVAMFDGDTDAAIAHISESSPCNITHLDRAWLDRNASIDLVEVSTTDSTARVEVDVEFGNADLFSTPYIESHIYRLEKVDSEWLITGVPWPVYDCGEITK